MGDDGAGRLLLGQRPGRGCDAGGAADQYCGGVPTETQGLDFSHDRPRTGVRASDSTVIVTTELVSGETDEEVAYRDEGIDGRVRFRVFKAGQVWDETGDHGGASTHDGTDSGHGPLQTQARGGLGQRRQSVQGRGELSQIIEPTKTVLQAVADLPGLLIQPHNRQFTDQGGKGVGVELAGESLGQAGSDQNVEIWGLLGRAHECPLHHGVPAIDPLLEELAHAGSGDEVGPGDLMGEAGTDETQAGKQLATLAVACSTAGVEADAVLGGVVDDEAGGAQLVTYL